LRNISCQSIPIRPITAVVDNPEIGEEREPHHHLSSNNAFAATNTRACVATNAEEGEAKQTSAPQSGKGGLWNISFQSITICTIAATANSHEIREERGPCRRSSPDNTFAVPKADDGEAKQTSASRSREGELRNISCQSIPIWPITVVVDNPEIGEEREPHRRSLSDNAFAATNTRACIATNAEEGEAKQTSASQSGEGELWNISFQSIPICTITTAADSHDIREERGPRRRSSPDNAFAAPKANKGESKETSTSQ
jgi:GTPase involved in cell partitioning and DNA repair